MFTEAIRLYNIIEGPDKKTNLAAQQAEVVQRLSTTIEGWYTLEKRKGLGANVEND